MGDEVDHRAIAIGIVGPGLVGKALIAQIAEQVREITELQSIGKVGGTEREGPDDRSCDAG